MQVLSTYEENVKSLIKSDYYNKQTLENTEGAIQKWTIQRNWQHWVHKAQDEDKQNKKHTTIGKQTQMTPPTNNWR
jgi:hypothetical protein